MSIVVTLFLTGECALQRMFFMLLMPNEKLIPVCTPVRGGAAVSSSFSESLFFATAKSAAGTSEITG